MPICNGLHMAFHNAKSLQREKIPCRNDSNHLLGNDVK